MALAISPQFFIDPAVAPFEPRWVGDSSRIDFQVERRAGHAFVVGQYAFTLAHNTQFDAALAIFEKARADGSINAQMHYWESEVYLLHGDLAKAIAVAEEALALDPEASVFVDRVQRLKALERHAEPPPPSVAPSLGARLRALLQKPFKLGMKKA